MRTRIASTLLALLLAAACVSPSNGGPPNCVSTDAKTSEVVKTVSPPFQGFYAKLVDDDGVPIRGHETVSDEAMLAAKNELDRMLSHAPKLRANLEGGKAEFHVIGKTQLTSELPEHRQGRGTRLPNGQLFDDHMRGGHIESRYFSCTEGVLLKFVGDRLYGNDACAHEIAHGIEWLALGTKLRNEIDAAYKRAITAKLWEGEYAASNQAEYFAELTRLYFTEDGHYQEVDPRLARGREWLRTKDPIGYDMVADLYEGRTDPGDARIIPIVLRPATDEATIRSSSSDTPTRFLVRNDRKDAVHVVWIDFDGKRDTRPGSVEGTLVTPGGEASIYTFAGHAWVILDDAGQAKAVVVATDDFGDVHLE